MCSLYLNTKNVAKRLGVKKILVDKIFRISKIPTIHRDNNGNKTLIEKNSFLLIAEVLSVLINCVSNTGQYSTKRLSIIRLDFFYKLICQYVHQDKTQLTMLADINDLFDLIVTFDIGFDRFIVHDFLTDTEYKFGKTWNLSSTTSQSKHKNKEHPVNGFWKNQPYGPRSNPSYKRIWVPGFTRGGKET